MSYEDRIWVCRSRTKVIYNTRCRGRDLCFAELAVSTTQLNVSCHLVKGHLQIYKCTQSPASNDPDEGALRLRVPDMYTAN